jgi:hypothetical protein
LIFDIPHLHQCKTIPFDEDFHAGVQISLTCWKKFWKLPVNVSFHTVVKMTETGKNKKYTHDNWRIPFNGNFHAGVKVSETG